MRAYIISEKDGTVLIGIYLYQPHTNKKWYVGRSFIDHPDDFPSVEVLDSSMESAATALKKFSDNQNTS